MRNRPHSNLILAAASKRRKGKIMEKRTFITVTLLAVFLVALGASLLACGVAQPNRDNIIGGAGILALGFLLGRLWMSIIWTSIEEANYYRKKEWEE